MDTDKTLACADCSQEFVFTASEQRFYADRGFSEPKRCSSCRAIRKAQRGDGGGSYGSRSEQSGYSGGYSGTGYSAGGSDGYERGAREMFSATCSDCGREARVPFQPSGNKPVYCSDCFGSRR